MAFCNAHKIDNTNWLLSVGVNKKQKQGDELYKKKRVALHYVIDNSGSMGSMTKEVQNTFSEMVDSVATEPSSMTIFGTTAQILSSNITTGQMMRDLELPPQSCTNIPAGIEKALRIIYGQEMKSKSKNEGGMGIHHIIILLSDGEHNSGPDPNHVFPKLKNIIPDDVKISVVVVGYSRHSNTSMGMLLKNNVETIPLITENVKTIYFARNKTGLNTALASLEVGLNTALKGTFHEIKAENKILAANLDIDAASSLQLHLAEDEYIYPLLCCTDKLPGILLIDKEKVEVVVDKEKLSETLLTNLIQNLIDRTKVHIVASTTNSTIIAKQCAKKLEALVKVLEANSAGKKDLQLKSASSKERVKQYRSIRSICQKAKELRNQVIDIANFSIQDSEKAANFLNGRSMKYANKALRRATKNSGGVLDPIAERKAIMNILNSTGFREELDLAMSLDILTNLMYLSAQDFNIIAQASVKDSENLKSLHEKVKNETEISHQFLESLNPCHMELIASGRLAEYLNEFCHGNRKSYLSLLTPWQHMEEWTHFNEQSFESTWEMLMYGGTLGYPLLLERSAASQMNPYLTQVKGVRLSLADTASICCANQAEFLVYGPEGGEPIKDILPLVDPSMPRSSHMICSSKLLSENYISAVIARDLHMYSGFHMQIALYSNTLFHLIAVPDQVEKDSVIANLRRTFMGRAYMCPQCRFGPVDHFACSDLMYHNGEQHGNAKVNNSCPRCNWFSPDLFDWDEWDGSVCNEFISSEIEGKKHRISKHLSQAKAELILRILYSFGKISSTSVKDEYAGIAIRIINAATGDNAEQLDLSEKSGIQGMSQILLAIIYYNGDNTFMDTGTYLERCMISIIQETCLREAIQRFRMKSGGDKSKAKEMAVKFLKRLLGVTKESAPITSSLMESERRVENVRIDCDDSIYLNSQMAQEQVNWVRKIAKEWCRVWSFVHCFHDIVHKHHGGWEKIERKMETGYRMYESVIGDLKSIRLKSPREFFRSHEGLELESLFLNIAVKSIFVGVLEENLQANVFTVDTDIDQGILHEAAREIRMKIYFKRVHEKLLEWKAVGIERTFYKARVADISAFERMCSKHVHGLDYQSFWGLWNAAKNTKNEQKILAFLSTANESFFDKHYNGKDFSL